jgi:hypothetical protein
MNFAVHVAIFAAINSGIWFVRTVKAADWSWTLWLTAGWLAVLVGHAIYIFAIANYSTSISPSQSSNPNT